MSAHGPLAAIAWARDQRAHRQLPRAEGDALQTLATFSDSDGVCRPGVTTIAAALRYSREHTHRLLHRLESHGLIVTERRGRQPAVRRLRLEIKPVEQLVLAVDQTNQTVAETPTAQTFDVTATSHQAPAQCDLPRRLNVTSGDHRKNQEELTEGSAREQDHIGVTPLAGALQEVLDILATAKPQTLAVEPLAINAALQAFPEEHGHAHRQAALEVVSWTWDANGPPSSSSANRLLMGALRKQSPAGAAPNGQVRRDRPVAGAASGRDFGRFERSAGW